MIKRTLSDAQITHMHTHRHTDSMVCVDQLTCDIYIIKL